VVSVVWHVHVNHGVTDLSVLYAPLHDAVTNAARDFSSICDA